MEETSQPLQMFIPSLKNPPEHSHLNDPIVFWQFVFTPQLSVFWEHSLTSENRIVNAWAEQQNIVPVKMHAT